MTLKHVVLVAMVTVALAYYFHSPLPDAIADQWTLKVILAAIRLTNQMVSWGGMLGYDSMAISRSLFSEVFKMTSYPVSDQGLVIKDTMISDVPTRIYRPDDVTPDELLPVVVYFHGGGMITFSVDTYDNILRHISKDVRAVVIAMNYRLAPEHPYPAPLEDCVKVTRHVMQHAAQYNGVVRRIAFAGDSAGGYLTPAVALKLATETPDLPRPKLQILLYPMLQAFDFRLPSYVVMNDVMHEIIGSAPLASFYYMYCTGKAPSKLAGLLANNHTSNELKKSKYASYVSLDILDDKFKIKKHPFPSSKRFDEELAKEMEGCVTDPYFSPLMAPDASLFPTSYVMTVEFDPLRDEGIMFVSRLKEAGVEFFHNHVSNGWHGIVSYTRTEGGRKALQDVIDFLIGHL